MPRFNHKSEAEPLALDSPQMIVNPMKRQIFCLANGGNPQDLGTVIAIVCRRGYQIAKLLTESCLNVILKIRKRENI
jgi:hypothetical protein